MPYDNRRNPAQRHLVEGVKQCLFRGLMSRELAVRQMVQYAVPAHVQTRVLVGA